VRLGSTPPQVHTPSQINQMANIFNVPRYAGMMPVLPASYRPSAMLPSVGVTPLPAPSLPQIQQMEAPTAALKEDSAIAGGTPIKMAGSKRRSCPAICPHQRQKSTCIDYAGSQVCPHKRQKSTCIDCGGSQVCPHQRRKSQCIDCGGSQVCPHKRQKSTCIDCGGSQVCPHKRIKSQCIDCGGSQVCPHKRITSGSGAFVLHFEGVSSKICSKRHRWRYKGVCAACEKDEPAVQWVTEFRDRSTHDVVFSMTEEEEIERLRVDGAPETFLDEFRRSLVAQSLPSSLSPRGVTV
jgi:hypothetical protein